MARHLQGTPPRLWDPVVRISHWVIAAVVIINGLLDQGGSTFHVWLGWIAGAALALRLVWGLIGRAEARFVAFPPRPRWAIDHLRDLLRGKPPEYRSHNPAGALMVYALWGSLAVVIVTGLLMTGFATPMTIAHEHAALQAGDWSMLARLGGEASLVKDLHEAGANLLLILAVLHVGGVAVESRMLRRNLVKPMFFGHRKRSDTPGA